ncbi:hypothetical protein L579_1611 [Pantoea sp. AS-PWVM4]|nr:hypothetical protein L579_1611 [Pantoea sp. AS-PWVM4]
MKLRDKSRRYNSSTCRSGVIYRASGQSSLVLTPRTPI